MNNVLDKILMPKQGSIYQPNLQKLDELLRNQAFEKNVDQICHAILNFLSHSVSAFRAVCFTYHNYHKTLELKATYGVLYEQIHPKQFKLKEGLIGQAAAEQEVIHFQNLDPRKKVLEFSSVRISASDILILPLVFNGKTLGVIEFSLFKPISASTINYLKTASNNIAATLESLLSAQITKDLINQTQAKKEALEAKEELTLALEELEATHQLLAKKNEELDQAFSQFKSDNLRLLSSIKYAKRIQNAILPSHSKLTRIFQDGF